MENYKKKAINLLIELALTENKHPSVIPYTPAKTEISTKDIPDLKRRLGGKDYRYSRALYNTLSELEEEKRANVHSLAVMADGEIILEASAPGYDIAYPHLAHSMSKTVTGLAVGLLVDDGRLSLDAPVINYFPEITPSDSKYSSLTVLDLLSMKSGVGFAELGTVTEDAWTSAFFNSKFTARPKEEFSYNSINSYILGKIISRITGISLYAFVTEKLFTPLGITNHFWETGPEGYTKGGFGLYLSVDSFAKLGQLILEGGCYFGKRILSSEYIKKMCTPVSDAPDAIGGFDYGLHVWVSPTGDEILFNGMLGQNVWIYPKENMLAVVNSGNNELFSDSPTLAIIRKNLKSPSSAYTATRADYRQLKTKVNTFFDSRRAVVTKEPERGVLYFLGIKNRRPFDNGFTPLIGRYATRNNNSGILPLFVSVMQNNYGGGIEYFAFERIDENLVMSVTEGGKTYNIPVGFYGYEESVLDFSGEKYIVRASAERMLDEERNPIYKIALIFPELPNVRIIKITHTDEGILIRMSEMPNEKIAETYFDTLTATTKAGFIINLVEKKMGEGFIKNKLTSLFNPSLAAIDTRTAGYREKLDFDNKEIAEKNESSAKLIKTLASKFLSDEKPEEDKEDTKPSTIGSFFKNALSLLLKVAKVKHDDTPSSTIIEIPDDTITFLDSSESDTKISESEDI